MRRVSFTSLLTFSFFIRLARWTCIVFGDKFSSAVIFFIVIFCVSFFVIWRLRLVSGF